MQKLMLHRSQRFMNDLLDLIVFSPDAGQRKRRSGALAGMGFSPRPCEDSNGLFRLFQARRTPLLVMEAELSDLCMAVAGLRAMDTTAGIIAISNFDSRKPHPGPALRRRRLLPGRRGHARDRGGAAGAGAARARRGPPAVRRTRAAPRGASADAAGKWQFQDAA